MNWNARSFSQRKWCARSTHFWRMARFHIPKLMLSLLSIIRKISIFMSGRSISFRIDFLWLGNSLKSILKIMSSPNWIKMLILFGIRLILFWLGRVFYSCSRLVWLLKIRLMRPFCRLMAMEVSRGCLVLVMNLVMLKAILMRTIYLKSFLLKIQKIYLDFKTCISKSILIKLLDYQRNWVISLLLLINLNLMKKKFTRLLCIQSKILMWRGCFLWFTELNKLPPKFFMN